MVKHLFEDAMQNLNCHVSNEKSFKFNMFCETDRVLLIGEGNFSFCVALFHRNLNINITATCYETSNIQALGKKNIEYLQNSGVRVLMGVDATNLRKHPILKTELFNKIVFNFPHVGGKMRIEKNRHLLREFFISSSGSLQNNGLILVTLCNGQGGTLMDDPPRRWDDSWKITEMAAHGNFVLKTVEPFALSCYENYIVTGYRSLDKQFHSNGALTHIFAKAEIPNAQNIAPKEKINISELNNDQLSWKDIKKNTTSEESCDIYAHTYIFDITFSTTKKITLAQIYTLLYNHAGLIISDVNYIKLYKPSEEIEKRTYRIHYQSRHFPLFRKRVIHIHQNFIANVLEENLNITVSR